MSAQRRWVRARRAALGAGAAAAIAALAAGALVALPDPAADTPAAPPHRFAYFADWNIANRGHTLADVDGSGAAARLTRIMWAFGDVTADGRCGIPADGDVQAWELYQRRYAAEDSVDGRADAYEQPLAGGLNQLRALRERHPDLHASISLGGWNWSTHFSRAARTPESRAAFAASCVDLWLRGDLPVRDGEPQGGPGAAEGVFDGIDLDWEWPGGGGRPGTAEHPDDLRNLTLLAAEFRDRLDALAAETGRSYTLTVSLPNDAEAAAGFEPGLWAHVDAAAVQGYDLTGSWSTTTGHHAQLHAPEGAPDAAAASVDATVRAYLAAGLPPEKLVVGVPGYGRGWTGVGPEGFGRFAPAEGAAEGGYGDGTEAYADLERREGRRFLDPVNGAYWLHDGGEWWSYDTPETIALKGRYVRDNGLAGLMLWNLDMDPSGDLVTAMDTALTP
jgi:chitinase